MEFYGFTRKNNSSVVITIPSRLNIPADCQVKVIIEPISPVLFHDKKVPSKEELDKIAKGVQE
jgi:hypothetical protein